MQSQTLASQPDESPVAPVDKLPAGLARRLAALTYDCVLLAGPVAIYAGGIVVLRGGEAVEPNTIWFDAGLLGIPALFFCWFWTHGGQTLGMVAWRIRVETTSGAPLSPARAAARFAAAWLSALPAGLGFFWALRDAERATWHDRLCGTRMVRTPPATPQS